MSDGIAVEGSRAGAVRQNMFVGLRLAAGAERAAELFFLPRSGRCCALLSPAVALLGQLMRG